MHTKKLVIMLFVAILAAGICLPTIRAATPITLDLGDITLSSNGATDSGHFYNLWNLVAGDMILSFTYDANGLVDNAGTHAWAAFGLRAFGYSDFNPTWMVEGAGVWLATDYDWTPNTFDPDTLVYYGAPYNGWYGTLDMDDKLLLQKAGGVGEGGYNLPSVPPAPGNNHRFWWDRDGVDPFQNGATANTGGIYQIVITLHATSATTGTAYMTIRGLAQGFETDGNWNTIELTPAGMTFTFPADTCMQVYYGLYGYGATHSVAFNDIHVTGVPCMQDVGGEWLPIANVSMLPQQIQWITLLSLTAIAALSLFYFIRRRKQQI